MCSIACAIFKTVTSSYLCPTIVIPTGNPSENPTLIDKAGCPVTSNVAVFLIIVNESRIFSENNN